MKEETFTVGEWVNSTWGKQQITGFIVNESNEMIVKFETCRNPLSKISKLPPTPSQPQNNKEEAVFTKNDMVRFLAFSVGKNHTPIGELFDDWLQEHNKNIKP